MTSELLRGLSRSLTLALALVLPSLTETQAQTEEILKGSGRAFLEAEAKEWIKSWLDQHPPTDGLAGFGGKAMFVVQLLFAADAFAKSDTDKQRFHAAANGATAYLAYAYAATPAVGIAVTAVYLAAQVVEGAIAGSYAEAMLSVQKDILKTEARIADLQFRLGMARAKRLILVDGLQQLLSESMEADADLKLDCYERAGDFATLGGCLEKLTRSVVLRDQQYRAVESLLALPDEDLAMFGTPTSTEKDGESDSQRKDPPSIATSVSQTKPPQPMDVNPLAKTNRQRLETGLSETKRNLEQLRGVYDGFVATYQRLAADYLVKDVLEGVERLEAIAEVRHRCLLDHTTLGQSAATLTYQLVRISVSIKAKSPPEKLRDEARATGAKANALLASYEQRRVSCPEVDKDENLARSMGIVRGRLARLPTP